MASMRLVNIVNSGVEPVTLTEAKLWLREDDDTNDPLISNLITAARQHAELFCRRSFMPGESWKGTLDCFPLGTLREALYYYEVDYRIWENEMEYFRDLPNRFAIEIPMGPVQSVDAISYIDGNGAQQTLATMSYIYIADDFGNPRIYPAFNTYWPVTQAQPGAVSISFTTGTKGGVTPMPATVRLAMQLMIGHWYANREAASATAMTEVPLGVKPLLWPHRILEL